MTTPIAPIPSVLGLKAYVRPATTVDLRLDANEVWYAELSDIAAEASLTVQSGTYPDTAPLELALARHHSVDPEQVIVTAGADDAIDRLCRAYLGPSRIGVMTVPGFDMIRQYVQLSGSTLVRIPWLRGNLPTSTLLASLTEGTCVAFIVSPCNPTGRAVPVQEIASIAKRSPNALIVHDAAYCDFADAEYQPQSDFPDNLVVLRTFSKAWGLAGLRIGYAIGCPSVIGPMRAVGQPYAVSSLSLHIAQCWLSTGSKYVSQRCKDVCRWRTALASACAPLGEVIPDAQGNFILVLTHIPLAEQLKQLGIAVRALTLSDDNRSATRISVPSTQRDQERLILALESVARQNMRGAQ